MTYISGSSVGTLSLGSLCFPVKRVNKGAPVSFTGIELRKLLEHFAGCFLRAFVPALGVGFLAFFVQCCRTRGRSRVILMHAGAVLVAPNLVSSPVFFCERCFSCLVLQRAEFRLH